MTIVDVVAKVIKKVKSLVVGNTAFFNAAFDKANAVLASEIKAKVDFKDRAMFHLFVLLRADYQYYSAQLLSDALYTAVGGGGDFKQLLAALKQTSLWHAYVDAAHLKAGRALGLLDVTPLALFNFRQGGTRRHAANAEDLAKALAHPADRMAIMVENSGMMGEEMMAPVMAMRLLAPEAYSRVVDAVMADSKKRVKKGKGTRTDKCLQREVVVTTKMVPHILNRFLKQVLKVESKLNYEVVQVEARRAKALMEIGGHNAEFTRVTVGGYTNLAGSDNWGYASPGEEGRVDVAGRQGNEELEIHGTDTIEQVVADLEELEEVILAAIKAVAVKMAIAEVPKSDITQAVYHYTPDLEKITCRKTAVEMNAVALAKWLKENGEKKALQRHEDARYNAASTHVPTFAL
jgi:hypothetical protein